MDLNFESGAQKQKGRSHEQPFLYDRLTRGQLEDV
jgi:hypothetical protein